MLGPKSLRQVQIRECLGNVYMWQVLLTVSPKVSVVSKTVCPPFLKDGVFSIGVTAQKFDLDPAIFFYFTSAVWYAGNLWYVESGGDATICKPRNKSNIFVKRLDFFFDRECSKNTAMNNTAIFRIIGGGVKKTVCIIISLGIYYGPVLKRLKTQQFLLRWQVIY